MLICLSQTQHQITAVVINKVSLFFKNEINSVLNVSKTKTDVFIDIILICSHCNLLIVYVCYLGSPRLAGKALSFTHELSSFLFFFINPPCSAATQWMAT